jgi:hypothetical protein
MDRSSVEIAALHHLAESEQAYGIEGHVFGQMSESGPELRNRAGPAN